MRIAQKTKKIGPVHPQVAALSEHLLATPAPELAGVLGAIETWTLPRSDLNAWVRVLNRLDDLLEDAIARYAVAAIQTRPFSPADKALLAGVLRFERLLLENTTNRKSFNSYDRINALLSTSDLDILILTLNLLLRPAQQYSAQQSVAQALNISTPRLQALAKRWTSSRELDLSLVDLVSTSSTATLDALRAEARDVVFAFYRRDDDKPSPAPAEPPVDVFKTPRKSSTSVPTLGSTATAPAGPVTLRIPASELEAKTETDVFADAIATHGVPAADQFELLCRIRASAALLPDRSDTRAKLATARLLALAIFCHTHPEAHAASALFLYEPDLPTHVAELLQLERGVPVAVQTAALAALDALGRYRGRTAEVLAAVNAGVSHGLLMALVRHTVADAARAGCALPPAFLDALLAFVTFLAQSAAGGSMVVSAGLVPLLVQLIEVRRPERLALVSKTMQLLDIVLYGFINAFQLFVAGRGVDALVGRIEHEIDTDLAEGGDALRVRDVSVPYGQLSVARAALLKHSLRSVHRMMQSSGTAEGLRGLIDSSLLQSVKKVIEYRSLFGGSILSIAINIMATFVHNEPTSLAVIQEAGLPQAFYKAIEVGLEPMIEVIQAVPNALGALCLNQEGLAQLASRPSIIPGLFTIFTSERHQKVLADKENAVMMGTAVDELVRHHPGLKRAVLDALRATLSMIEELGNAYVPEKDQLGWYVLLPTGAGVQEVQQPEDVTMAELEGPVVVPPASTPVPDDEGPANENTSGSSGNSIVSFIDVLGRFLEGLFQHHLHCEEFITTMGGLDFLGRITALPCLPYDFGNSLSSDSLVQVVRTLAEANAQETLAFLSRLVRASLDATASFWEAGTGLAGLLEFGARDAPAANARYRALITLQTRVTLISEVYASAGHSSGRTAHAVLQALLGPDVPQIVPALGALHRACIRENVVLKRTAPAVAGAQVERTTLGEDVEMEIAPAASVNLAVPAPDAAATSLAVPALDQPDQPASVKRNSQALKQLVTQIPAALAPLFQATVKMFTTTPRRAVDPVHRQLILDSAPIVADVLLKHVTYDSEEDKATLFSYWAIALGVINVLLVEERNEDSYLYTVLLSAFVECDGITALLNIGRRFVATIERVGALAPADRTDSLKEELVCAYAGLKVLLHFLQPIISARPIIESPQTALLIAGGKKEGEPGFFSPQAFLVRMRIAVLPFVAQVWEGAWLLEAPLSLIKSVVHIVMELVRAENEEAKDGVPGMPTIVPAVVQPDETRITQITDMGFSRGAARRALMRTRNNVATATELLITQPFLFPAGDDDDEGNTPAAPPVAEPIAAVTEPDTTPAPNDSAADASDVEVEEALSVKTSEQWLAELRELRDPLEKNVGRVALRVVDAHPGLIFEVQSLFVGTQGSKQEPSIRQLVDDIKTFSPAAYDVQEQPLAVRCRLLALSLSHPGCQDVVKADAKNLMDSLLALLLSRPADGVTQPKWLAAHLLVADALLMMGEQPRAITLPAEGDAIVLQALNDGSAYPEARTILFDTCMRLIGLPTLAPTDLLSCLRILILLTREHRYALELAKRGGVASLLACIRQGDKDNALAVRTHVMVLLRHVVEDPAALQGIMRLAFKRYFANPKLGTQDIGAFVRGCGAVALRDPAAFVEAAGAVCKLSRPFGPPQLVSLKEAAAAAAPANVAVGVDEKEKEAEGAIQVDGGAPAHEALEPLVHLLIKELLSSSRTVLEEVRAKSTATAKDTGTVAAGGTDASSTTPAEQQQEGSAELAAPSTDMPASKEVDASYACYVMQALAELLFSYDSCKMAFLAYTEKKRGNTPSKDKARPAALQYLLTDLVNVSALDTKANDPVKPPGVLCNWAMSIIVALCVDTAYAQDMKDLSPEVVLVRKTVLDAVARAFREVPVALGVEARYGRLMALSDLVYRLLTVRPHFTTKKPQEDTPTHLAKLMLEKNFVALLTTAFNDVDLNYPHVKNLVTTILKPLELLSRVAIKMSRSADRSKTGPLGSAEEPVPSSEEEDEDESDEEDMREETPDLYRNSSLGMFTGEMEDAHYAPQDDMADNDIDENDDIEMEYADETGSEATSHSEGDDADLDTPALGDDWVDEEGDASNLIENEEEGDDDLESMDEGDDEQDEDDEEGDEEDARDDAGMWPTDPGMDDDEADEGDEHVHVVVGDDEAADTLSEAAEGLAEVLAEVQDGGMEDEDGYELVGDVPHALPMYDTPFLPLGGSSARRIGQGNADLDLLGLTRPNASALDVVTHPLLHDPTHTGNQLVVTGSRSRRTQRHDTLQNIQHEIISSIQETLGATAVHVFQRLMMNRQGNAGGARTLDMTDLAATSRAGRSLRVLATESSRTSQRGFEPLLTSHRWSEEARMLYGRSALERLIRLENHATLAMIPSAIEDAEAKRKEAEAEAAAERQRLADEEKARVEEEEKTRQAEEEKAHRAEADRSGDVEAAEGRGPIAQPAPATEGPSNTSTPAPEAAQSETKTAPVTSDAALPGGLPSASADIPVPQAPSEDADHEMEDATTGEDADNAESTAVIDASDAGPSTEPARVTVMIHGNTVDITDTGIDPDFLEALPDDMREEVLNQHMRDQRASRVERPADSQISPEFLDALPPEIRAEIIQQENMERAARAPPAVPVASGPPPIAAEIDPASFIASLDPQLRQVIMMEQDEGFIQTLPSHMVAEANMYREIRHPRAVRRERPAEPAPSKKAPPPRDAIQLVDKVGVATLVRLLFFPQALRKSLLLKVLLNLCENAKTRTELLTLLTSILQDGTADIAAIDKSFAQLSVQNVKSPVPQTPKTPSKQRSTADSLGFLALSSHEAVPELIAQRSLEALSYVVNTNELCAVFFLTQHELTSSMKRSLSKKGKGKEKQTTTHFPIVSLLGLLDRRTFLKTPSIMEGVVGLLANVTRPLSSLSIQFSKKEVTSEVSAAVETSDASAASMTAAVPSNEQTAPVEGPAPPTPGDEEAEKSAPKADDESQSLIMTPPQIPAPVLRLVVNILTMGECSGRTFQQTLALIQHLSLIPDSREVVAQELREKAQASGQVIQDDLTQLASVLDDAAADTLLTSAIAKFSLASSEQAKLLRILKTIDYMFKPKSSDKLDEKEIEQVQSIYESFRFTSLWSQLGKCLDIIEEHAQVEHVATVLLPLIEALMVVCKHVGSASPPAGRIASTASPRTPTSSRESMEDLFVSFTDAHRVILNLLVRSNPSLMSGSFSLLVNNPRVLDFDNKRNYFNQQLRRRTPREQHGTLQLNVRRQRVFEDSFQYLQRKTGDQIKYGKLSVRFYDEEGVDAGGLTREWFQILARQMFNPDYALFQPCVADKLTYQPNRASWVNPEHLSFFKFVGRVIGKAIFDGRLLDAYFARSFYRQLLGKPVDYRDVEWVDPEYYNSLCWILENDPEVLDLNFSVEADEFGVTKMIPLKENGTSITVTNETKKEFVQLSAQYRLYSSIKDQIDALLNGFYDVIPKDLISIFNEQEVELLISGTPDVDVDEWRASTEYRGYTGADTAIVWWWRALKSFNREERAKVLSFATGTSRVPLGGFGELQGVQGVQKFSIHRAYGTSDRLPQAHTCFNQIDLPEYTSYEKLRQQLLVAINEGGEGFGFA